MLATFKEIVKVFDDINSGHQDTNPPYLKIPRDNFGKLFFYYYNNCY